MPEFLDLTHHYVLLGAKAENHDQINQVLLGPPRIGPGRTSPVDERAGFTPPAWWKGDDYASRSGIAAALTLRR